MGKIVKIPNTKQVQLGGLSLQLRLTPKDIYDIENRLKESLFGLFMNGDGGVAMPSLKKVLIVLQGSNQVSGISDSDVFDAVCEYLEEGHTTMDLINIVQELLNDSGFFGKEKPKTGEPKETPMSFDEDATDFQA